MCVPVMRKASLMLLLAAAFLMIIAPVAKTQEALPPQLAKLAEALECRRVRESMPEWKQTRTEPIKGSKNVLIENWSACGRIVSVSIIWNTSEAEAIAMMKRGATSGPTRKTENLGDEAYAWGTSDQITFRKGNLVVSISSTSHVYSFLIELDHTERVSVTRAEEVALNKGFARFVARVLANPEAACQPLDRY